MSKVIRKKHQTIINLLLETTQVITRLLKEDKLQACLILLVECQDSAIVLGNHIEKLYGLNTKTVHALEQYCETLYQVSGVIEDASREEILDILKDATELVQSTYEEEFPDKKEVVFLPYNASMWDSLESVWMAARDDETCNAYVVPIPYYNWDENHCMKDFHYEGDKYPDYVPITPYQEYDLELRHPDIIFIHNPYDESNAVTSVVPEFYSSRIKDYTERLVYIPYYIIPGRASEKDASFVLTNGVMNADRVYVQSEDIRNFYLDTIQKNNCHANLVQWKEKIIALGSPKTDRIVNTNKNDLVIPSEWKNIIKNRKIVFFNTNVRMLLQNPENIIENLRRIFDVFRSHSDIVVIWREHPLTESTINSMMPTLRDEYIELRNKYIEEKWGILDETKDPYTAMILSDCYFGAGGSLSAIYPVTGKPIMIMDYLYPKQISEKEITVEELKQRATLRMLYLERNRNALDVFLASIEKFETEKEQRRERQAVRMNNLDGTVGKKIYSAAISI